MLAALTLVSSSIATPPNAFVDMEADITLTSTLSATVTFQLTTTQEITLPTPSTSTSSSSYLTTSSGSNTTTSAKPTYTATQLYAFNPDSPVHLLPFQAAGLVFRLGGVNAAYCPSYVERIGGCSNTNITTMSNCSLVSSYRSL